jgi:hypothetical protein
VTGKLNRDITDRPGRHWRDAPFGRSHGVTTTANKRPIGRSRWLHRHPSAPAASGDPHLGRCSHPVTPNSAEVY